MRSRLLGLVSALLLLGGCATAAVQADIEQRMARREAAALAEAQTQGAVSARLRAWCGAHQDACRVRWWAERLPTRLHWFRTDEPIPPYAVTWGVIEEEMRRRVEATLGQSYDWAILQTVFEQWDRGEWTDEQAMALVDYHYRQRQEMAAQYERLFQLRLANAQAQDMNAFAAALGVTAAGLNTYAATLRPGAPPTGPAPSPSRGSQRVPARLLPETCTYRLNALQGLMLCVDAEGNVRGR